MRSLIFTIGLVVLAIAGFIFGLAADLPGFMIIGFCGMPFAMFFLGYAVHRAGLGISVNRSTSAWEDVRTPDPMKAAQRGNSGF